MPLLLLAYLAFLGISLPDGLLGVSWPSMSVSFGQTVGALGLVLPFAVVSSMLSSASTGVLLTRIGLGRILTGSIGLYALALLAQSLAPAFWVFIVAVVVLAAGSGAIDASLNAFAARQFNARQITWLHAVYGLGAAAGPLLFVATAAAGLSWRWAFALVAALQAVLTVVFALTSHLWQTLQQPRWSSRPGAGLKAGLRLPAAVWSGASVFALQTGVESGTAFWAYLFLTDARAVPSGIAAARCRGTGSPCSSDGWHWGR
jgi:MFS family permease